MAESETNRGRTRREESSSDEEEAVETTQVGTGNSQAFTPADQFNGRFLQG
jgi:hypothetical protein